MLECEMILLPNANNYYKNVPWYELQHEDE